MELDELAEWVREKRLHIAHWFTVDDLHHLKRGGRVSGAAAFVGTMLNIKPVLHVDDEGHLIPMEKVRGRKTSLDTLVEHMKKTGTDFSKQTVFISHSDCLEDAEYVAERVKKDLVCRRCASAISGRSSAATPAWARWRSSSMLPIETKSKPYEAMEFVAYCTKFYCFFC